MMAKPGYSNAKGGNFERRVSKDLSLLISKGSKKDLFWRSPSSGGRATIAIRIGDSADRISGDVIALSEEGRILTEHFLIECKAYKDVQFDSFIIKSTGLLQGFWEKTCIQAKSIDKHPLLIVKENFVKPYILLWDSSVRFLQRVGPICLIARKYVSKTDYESSIISIIDYEKFVNYKDADNF